jgi:hypothetical protein|tara:strand:- start:573 stop:896 length:324 start_codon:yes stop_codon:yes gene_type:complete
MIRKKAKKTTYMPLPAYVGVAPSTVHGIGLIALQDIKKGHEFGISHVRDDRFEDGHIRTPLGGFFNHSDKPNCETYVDDDLKRLRSLRAIKRGEEITAKYTLYKVKK